MKYSGIIFDFNGTLFWDSDKHKASWRIYSQMLRGHAMSDEELNVIMLGRTNLAILEYLLERPVDHDELLRRSMEKEEIYRDMCKSEMPNLSLAPGAVEFLDFVLQNNIPHIIATGSEIGNVLFYFDIFPLNRWFDIDHVIYDDHTLPGKPDPRIYQVAADKLGLRPSDCIVFEDAPSGVEAARRAGAGKIIAVGKKSEHPALSRLEGVSDVICDFAQVDRALLGFK